MRALDERYFDAYQLALDGKLEAAENALRFDGELGASRDGCDLLARIRIEQDRQDEAIQIWRQILKANPADEGARTALDELDAERTTRRNRRLGLVALAAVMCGIGLACGFAFARLAYRSSVPPVRCIAFDRAPSGPAMAAITEGCPSNTLFVVTCRGRSYIQAANVAEALSEHAKITRERILVAEPPDGFTHLIEIRTLPQGRGVK